MNHWPIIFFEKITIIFHYLVNIKICFEDFNQIENWVNLKRHLSVTITTYLNYNGFMMRSPLNYLIKIKCANQILSENGSAYSHSFFLQSKFHSVRVQFYTKQGIQHLLTSTNRYYGSYRSSSKRT
jgi:hypothetical protein